MGLFSGGGDSAPPIPLNPAYGEIQKLVGGLGTELQGPLQQLISGEALQPNQFEQLAQMLSQNIQPAFQQSQNLLSQQVLPTTEELLRTGFRTDIAPITAQAQRNFSDVFLPELAERVSPLFGDFGNLASRRGADISSDLGALQTQLDEAAANRRAGGIPTAMGVAAANTALPINVTGDLFGLGQAQRQSQLASSQIPLNTFATLAGLGQGQQFFQPGFNTQDKLSDTLGGIASITGALSSIW